MSIPSSIRYHDGIYWIFWGDPDYGIYQVHTDSRGDDRFLHFEDRNAYGRVLHSWRAVCSRCRAMDRSKVRTI